jgi:hypothetical protein
MALRTVRLDDEAEKALKEIRDATGLPISEALKRGLRALRKDLQQKAPRTPYEIYRKLNLGPGGSAIGPSTEVSRLVKESIRKKLGR